jgi:hypothetical protein
VAVRAPLLLMLAVALASPASAQVLYKLIDREGRVTYSDREPKDFDGKVIRLEPDVASNIVPSPKAAEPAPAGASPVTGVADQRRRTREDLDRKLREAQLRVEVARKAKAEGVDPLPEELQTTQHRYRPLAEGELPPRPNCFHAADASGAVFLNCPTPVPSDAFYARQKKLDDDLKRAEEELALAERAYRRGTD